MIALLVELLARDGEVASQHRIDRLPASIGRALDSDVVVDDPYVAPLHLWLQPSEDGVVARDGGSRNGTYLLHGPAPRLRWWRAGGERRAEVPLQTDTRLRIGHTVLRIRRTDQPVPAELPDTFAHGWEGAPLAAFALMAIVLTGVFTTWYGNTEGTELLQTLRTALAVVGGAALWAGIWAIFSRIFAGRLRFGRHLFIAACALLAAFIWEEVSELLAYALSLPDLAAFNSIGGYLILGVAVFHHLRTIRPHRPRAARNLAVTTAAALIAFSLIQNEVSHRRLGDDLYLSALKPPALRLATESSTDAFLEAAHQLKADVDRERSDQPGDGDNGDGDDDAE